MGNEEDQREELEVLHSIFDENILTINSGCVLPEGTLFACVVLPDDFKITQRTLTNETQIQIQFLPPMKLLFKFVPEYPSISPPAFLLACQWLELKHISALCKKLHQIWLQNQPQVVIFCWMQFLQEESLAFLGIKNHLDISNLTVISQPVTELYFSQPSLRKCINSRSRQTYNNDKQSCSREKTVKPQIGDRHRKLSQSIHAICRTDSGQNQYDERAVLDLVNGTLLLPRIIEWNKKCKQEAFNKEWFSCKVCLSEKQGVDGLRFDECNHLYCRECMEAYFRVQIHEGNVQLLNCPEEKCPSQALPSQVYELVGKELYDRYDKLLLESALAKMSDVINCPRPNCQCSSVVDKTGNVGSCSECQYHFCLLCKKAYHGLEPCRFRDEEKNSLREKYVNADTNEKLSLEQRYGKKNLIEMINDSLSNDWVQFNSKRCPHCNACIEKSDGCNKMTCWRCNTMFCWLCGKRLSTKEPYLHYNDLKSQCFGFLFHGVEPNDDEDSDEDDIEFGQFL